ncbi:probable serine/threonine-protein kinase PBL7 isoform X2 [Solanum pennellii]|uniref:Probable serine/threonine-protein kinase PBL7 isoform X2 n=1 Tax=Solanum pennellii TaxID=28526 RepID=A0ABM1V2V8_SOLPN|nr:probable serine/threonine-protein kinase PBL7 isoform X2 [Solanum pennellii]
MGPYCPCFRSKKKGINLKTKLTNTYVPIEPTTPPNSHLPPVTLHLPDNAIKHSTLLEPTQKVLISKHDSPPRSNLPTFSYRDIATATNNFRRESIIGEGGFGPVFKGKLNTNQKLNHSGLQGDKEFFVEVHMLSLMRHPNLVNLIGYCSEGEQRLLIYEFMPLGSLEYHLHDITPDMKPLDWDTRMVIASGAAKGLEYLHNQADRPVIYRDLKSANILLGEGFHAKLSDFGLAKFGPIADNTHVSTRVMGTHGYCAPEYAGTGKLTMKSDIYSFGVLLLELITGCRAMDDSHEHGKEMLVDWARPMLKDRMNYVQLADPMLRGKFPQSVFRRVVELVLMCVQDDPHARPLMKDIVLALSYFASQKHDSHAAQIGSHGGEGTNGSSVDFDGAQMDVTEIRASNKDQERERAVAEAKKWGETWREKGKQNADDDLDYKSRW